MSIYAELPIVAFIVVYIVDVSGFTDSWRGALARALHIRELRPLKPFDCSLCMTWWVCLIYAAIRGPFTLLAVAESALLSCLSITISAFLLFLRELLLKVIDIITPR